jgi:prepilin-type N-terminal cleavage/methylation domain-containing protein
MRPNKKTKRTRSGFTLVEMLTALAVIAVLLALLIPALNMVQKKAQTVRQKGQFHAIEVGLDAFRSDWGDYPPSEYAAAYGVQGDVSPFTCAAQRLAEALVGRDGLGFHKSSVFRARGLAYIDGDVTLDPNPQTAPGIYNATGGFNNSGGTSQSAADNLASRWGPYLELETANAVPITDIYRPADLGFLDTTYILSDAFPKKMRVTGKEIGMPILYYRANTGLIGHDPIRANWGGNTYNLNDSFCSNNGIIAMDIPFQSSSGQHPLESDVLDDAVNIFYSGIANPNFTAPPRPYRANSFLLHSAGLDGLYGTPDDMFNF